VTINSGSGSITESIFYVMCINYKKLSIKYDKKKLLHLKHKLCKRSASLKVGYFIKFGSLDSLEATNKLQFFFLPFL
jgi:hypothetical protein